MKTKRFVSKLAAASAELQKFEIKDSKNVTREESEGSSGDDVEDVKADLDNEEDGQDTGSAEENVESDGKADGGVEVDDRFYNQFSDDGEEEEDDGEEGDEDAEQDPADGDSASDSEDDDDNPNNLTTLSSLLPTSTAAPLSKSSLTKLQAKIDKSGVCYLSRIPPFMKPTKLRTLLSRYGTLNRIYLTPEDPSVTARRKKYKHNRRQNFTEGWVEFTDKRVARSTADLLNGKQIGGKKRSFYYDDIWNIKYLPKFKWHHLAEQIAYEVKVREQRVKAEMAQAKRENKAYVKNVEKAKMIEGMEGKKAAKKRKAEEEAGVDVGGAGGGGGGAAAGGGGMEGTEAIRRRFKQRKVVDGDVEGQKTKTGKTKALLGRIFA
ncbi:RNA-binding ATPase activator esf2 [Rhizophlyctis rosea]|nr:RNA-binding ATPase activator esf2 [Rhizophlyctis rosea]